MTQSETIQFLNNKKNLKLEEHLDQYNSYDAFDDNYLVEIKNRTSEYKDPFLEVNKTLVNLKKAKEENKQYIYVQQDNTGVYVFNVSKLDLKSIYRRFFDVPASTLFENKERLNKEFWVLNKSLATIIEL
jgi:hypothetical protein|tara:strand:+ start:597 stop:986 length:390 start_codon:yes stop_codon:yes gene_type:complete